MENRKFIKGINGDGRNIFEEIQKFRGQQTTVCSMQYGAKKYCQLYDNVQNGTKLDKLRCELMQHAGEDHESVLAKINNNLISTALKKMKPGKRDSIFDSTSDCYLNGPENLTVHLTNLIRMFIVHGSLPNFILLCTLLPLVKNSLGDITRSEN